MEMTAKKKGKLVVVNMQEEMIKDLKRLAIDKGVTLKSLIINAVTTTYNIK
jgi:hypothetical protein